MRVWVWAGDGDGVYEHEHDWIWLCTVYCHAYETRDIVQSIGSKACYTTTSFVRELFTPDCIQRLTEQHLQRGALNAIYAWR